MIVFDIVFGAQNNWPCQIVNRDESLPQPGDFIASDVLTATVAPGESLPAIFTPTVTWYQTTGYTTGLTFLSITSAECELLAPNETYTIQIFATRGSGDPVCVWMGKLFVIPAAGSTAPAAVFPAPSGAYAGFSDLEFYAPWLDEVMDALTDQAGFMNYLMRARTWLDRIIVARHRPLAYIYNIFTPLTPWGPVEAPNYIIQGYMAANYLLVRDVTLEIICRRALHQIADKMVSYAPDDVWPRRSRYMRDYANNLLCSYNAELSISSAPSVYITDPTGGGALALATINGTLGTVTGLVPQIPGVNYTNPTVTLYGQTGTGATAVANLGPGGGITSYTVTNPGAGYYQKQTPDIAVNLGMVSMR